MLESLIDRLTRASLRFKWVTIGLSLLMLVAGVVALTQLKQELIPAIDFPQTIVLALNPGAEIDTMRDEVTIPLEDSLKEIDGVVNIESTTSSGVAFIIVMNEFGLNQETIQEEVQAIIESHTYPEGMNLPEMLTFSLSDLPMAALSVSSSALSLPDLKVFVEEQIIPALEAVPDVAAVEVSGGQELPTEPPPTSLPTEEPTPTLEPTVVPTESPTEAISEGDTDIELVTLPESWIQGAAAQSITIETTSDLTPEFVSGIVDFAPQMLAELTLEMLLSMPDDAFAALPEDYLAGLSPEVQEQLAIRITPVEPEPAALPESWIAAMASQGITVETTADLTPEIVGGIASFAPQMLAELTPDMLLAMPVDALAVLPADYLAGLDPEVQEQLAARMTPVEPDPVALPQSWIDGMASQGITIETTADLTPEIVGGIASFAPQMLAELTPDMLLAMPVDALAALPADYLAGLDPDLGAQLNQRLASAPETEQVVDPGELPPAWQSAGEAQGITLVNPQDVTPEILQGIAGFAPQLLDQLTPDHLRLFSAEVLGWLPAGFIENLAAELYDELDDIAQSIGGLGVLAAEAEAFAAQAPELTGAWRQPPPEDATGPIPSFETAADLTNSGFVDSAAELLNLMLQSGGEDMSQLMADLSLEVIAWLIDNEEGFLENLSPAVLRLLSPDVLTSLPEEFMDTLDEDLRVELAGIAAGTLEVFIPTDTINRVDGNPSLALILYQDDEANTVALTHIVFDKLDELEEAHDGLRFDIVFEQATFIEESISGVTREGGLGAIFAVIVILIFLSGRINKRYILSWRSTLVTAVSIPLSVFMAFALLKWLPPIANVILEPLVNTTAGISVLGPALAALHNLFPVGVTLNMMTLSGMTVAIGRVVDDSIVVLENIYRHIQRGKDPRESVLDGTRDVAIAIFASTVTTIVVFLPIGLLGGLIGEFFLPFGVSVMYALGSSFLVAVTIVPLLAFLFIRKEHLPPESETLLQRWYTPVLQWALDKRVLTVTIAGVLLVGSMFLLAGRPRAFIPSMGEVQISVSVDLPNGISMAGTNDKVSEFENALQGIDGIGVVHSEIGFSGGLAARFLGASIDQSAASIEIGVGNTDDVDALIAEIREVAESVFIRENVTVSSGTLSSSAFGGFGLVLSGDPEQLAAFDEQAKDALNHVAGITNVTSNLADMDMYLRVDGQPSLRYSGELETADSLGVTEAAKAKLEEIVPAGITISEGFETQMQTEGFTEAVRAIVISIVVVYLVMVITFRSFVHPFTILFSLPLAVIGAAVALWMTDRVVGISALVGMMMLVGIVVTNAIVLIDRVQANRKKRGLDVYDALVEAGRTRLRPVLMTAIVAMLALVPMSLGLTEGAIIATELATVVIGGLFTSTLLTLVVVPVMYGLLDRFAKKK